jgi:WD40 repeat protein
VSAVMDVDYSPTGREFVAGSYDRSIRIFGFNSGHSKEVSSNTVLHSSMVCVCVNVSLYVCVCVLNCNSKPAS